MIRIVMKDESDKQKAIDRINALDVSKKTYILECKAYHKKRSLPQNKLYRLWLACIADETGETTDNLHDEFRSRWLPPVEKEVFGNVRSYLMSTKKLNTAQFVVYLNCIDQFARENNIVLKRPVDREFERFFEQYKDYIG